MIYSNIIREQREFTLPTELEIMQEYYENEISFLKSTIEYQDAIKEASINESSLEAIHEGRIETIKSKIKEIIDKFIEFLKKVVKTISGKISHKLSDVELYNNKYKKIYNSKILPLAMKNKSVEDAIPILRSNGFIKEPADYIKKQYKPGLYVVAYAYHKLNFNINNGDRFAESLGKLTDEIMSKHENFEEILNSFEFGHLLDDLQYLEDTLDKAFTDAGMYESKMINDLNELKPSNIIDTKGCSSVVKKCNDNYQHTAKFLESETTKFKTGIIKIINSGEVNESDASQLTSLANRIVSYNNKFITKYSECLEKVTKVDMLKWYFYVIEE